jgi:putative CocE/NonD family hydrolase
MLSSLALSLALVAPIAQSSGSAPPQAAPAAPRVPATPGTGDVVSVDGVVPLADGTTLAYTLHHPKDDGPWPVVLVRTPYGRHGLAQLAAAMVEKGAAILVQDVRGRGNSTGEWEPFRHEEQDGAETFDWLLAQPWCSGKVATYGMSYLGITQWQLAPHAGPRLAAMVNQFSSADIFRDVVHFGGVQGLAISLSWLSMGAGHGMNVRFDHLPLIEADDVSGGDIPAWDQWCSHPLLDDYWRPLDFAPKYKDVRCAALLVAGWYDLFLPGQLDDYQMLSKRDGPPEQSFVRLIVGPWDHGGPGNPLKARPDLGPEAFVPPFDEERNFLDRFFLGAQNGFEQKAGVRAFFLGENRWHELSGWPPANATERHLYLHSLGGAAKKPDGNGLLLEERPPARDEAPDPATFDPADPCPSYATNLWTPLASLSDQAAIAQRQDVLVFATQSLPEEVRVAGPLEVELWFTSDAPDCDFAAKLVDVAPDGSCEWRGEGIQRARTRESPATERLVTPGEPTKLTVRMGHIACTFAAGHRIGLDLTGSNFPRFSRNLNVAERSNVAASGRPAHVRVLHDRGHPSRLTLWQMASPDGGR